MPIVVLRPKVKLIVRGVPGPPGDPLQPFTSIKFDTVNPDAVDTQGQMAWNNEEETVDLKQDGAVLQLGQEVQWPVRNQTGSNITNGTVVMASGTIGATGRILISPMDGTDTTNAKFILGIATHDIGNAEDGKVTAFGKVRELDTSSWTDGDVLWVSSTTAGELTNVEPLDGNIGLPIAFVVNSHATIGVLSVRVTPIDEHNFSGRIFNYEERSGSITFTAGAATLNHTTIDNIMTATLTQDSTITFTDFMAYKPITIAVTQSGGPWTLDLAYGAKTLSVNLNGSANEVLETVEIWTDGTDLFVPDNGGVTWSPGT